MTSVLSIGKTVPLLVNTLVLMVRALPEPSMETVPEFDSTKLPDMLPEPSSNPPDATVFITGDRQAGCVGNGQR